MRLIQIIAFAIALQFTSLAGSSVIIKGDFNSPTQTIVNGDPGDGPGDGIDGQRDD